MAEREDSQREFEHGHTQVVFNMGREVDEWLFNITPALRLGVRLSDAHQRCNSKQAQIGGLMLSLLFLVFCEWLQFGNCCVYDLSCSRDGFSYASNERLHNVFA